MSWLSDKWNQITNWFRNDVRGGTFSDSGLGDIFEYILGIDDDTSDRTGGKIDAFVDDMLRNGATKVGDIYNDITGATSGALLEDELADENATIAHNRQKELMQIEADYNSPQYKAEQLAKTGLNPALASGMSNAVGGASAQMSTGGTATPKGNPIGDLLGFAKLKNDMRLVDAEVKVKEAQASNLDQQTKTEAENTKYAQQRAEKIGALMDAEISEYEKRGALSDAQADLARANKDFVDAQKKKIPHEIWQSWITTVAGSVGMVAMGVGSILSAKRGLNLGKKYVDVEGKGVSNTTKMPTPGSGGSYVDTPAELSDLMRSAGIKSMQKVSVDGRTRYEVKFDGIEKTFGMFEDEFVNATGDVPSVQSAVGDYLSSLFRE